MPRKVKERKFPDWLISEASEEYKDKIISGIVGSNEVIEWVCQKHGKYMLPLKKRIRLSDMSHVRGCPKCGKERQHVNGLIAANKINRELEKDKEYTKNRARNLTKGRYELRSENISFPQWFIDDLAYEEDKELARTGYLGSHRKCMFICQKHGIYEQWVYQHILISTMERKCSCPRCANYYVSSSYEEEINNYIQSVVSINVERNIRGIIRSGNSYYEIDLFYPERNIGIEFNGSYWHSSLGDKVKYIKPENYHMDKFLKCEEKGIHLIQIFDVDWNENRYKIEMYLRSLFGSNVSVYARNTELKRIDIKDAREFCDEYHLQGKATMDSIAYGLFLDDNLYSVMTFGLQRFNKKGEGYYELHRYCVREGYTIIGGAQRLLKRFENDFNPIEVISYSDNDYFTGEIYSKLEFEFDGYTNPRYYWYKGLNDWFKREQCMLKNLKLRYPETYDKFKDFEGNKEDAIMRDLGYIKVYRSGNKRWIKRY